MAKRRAKAKTNTKAGTYGATVGYEIQLWAMADALRGSMAAEEYKHVVLGLIFLKYIRKLPGKVDTTSNFNLDGLRCTPGILCCR